MEYEWEHFNIKVGTAVPLIREKRFRRPYLNTAVSGAPAPHCLKDELTNNNSAYLISASSRLTRDPLCKRGDLQVTTRNNNDIPHWKLSLAQIVSSFELVLSEKSQPGNSSLQSSTSRVLSVREVRTVPGDILTETRMNVPQIQARR